MVLVERLLQQQIVRMVWCVDLTQSPTRGDRITYSYRANGVTATNTQKLGGGIKKTRQPSGRRRGRPRGSYSSKGTGCMIPLFFIMMIPLIVFGLSTVNIIFS